MTKIPKKPAAQKPQHQRFIDAAREAGASEDEAVFDENLKLIAKVRPKPARPEPEK